MSNSEINAITRESIYLALQQLLETKALAEITVTEITSRAGVSRMGYYRNYQSKEEILLAHLDELFINYYLDLEKLPKKEIFEFSLHFFNYFEDHHQLVELLIKTALTNELLLKFKNYLEKIISELLQMDYFQLHSTETYEIHFLVGGLWNLLLNWILDERPHPSEHMAHIIDDLGLTILGK
ncbi:TetR/AcrR family transcriptional regulator [uncultured Vagococcus sp.]|uniref:TetR/AcrR family transcriptional regulator n=1 Tax=uncultured Vagococcus sp. TaxID=189676 RepID=UPI0028D3B87A|nr:TetR/AcrR family transcriptional regulator [uncultured Vagococcus sp.]